MVITATGWLAEFDRQVQNLIDKGYPAIAGLSASELRDSCQALHASCAELAGERATADRVPFVLVVKQELVSLAQAMAQTELRGKAGFIDFKPGGLERFAPLDELRVPAGALYLLVDVDTGTESLNMTPDDALLLIRRQGRTPLTLEEGIALITHFPDRLRKNRCFSLLGSRSDDRRVPALWISQGRPKLGWCWAGNPHTWLGSASCGGRRGV